MQNFTFIGMHDETQWIVIPENRFKIIFFVWFNEICISFIAHFASTKSPEQIGISIPTANWLTIQRLPHHLLEKGLNYFYYICHLPVSFNGFKVIYVNVYLPFKRCKNPRKLPHLGTLQRGIQTISFVRQYKVEKYD